MKDQKKTRRNKIIDCALKIFAEKGFQEATISEISKAAGVSDATVYEYFNTKEELLFSIPEKIAEETFLEFKEKALPFLRGTESKIRAMVQAYMLLYEKNPYYSALVMLQLKTNRNYIKTESYKKIRDVARELLKFIQEGIENGTFEKNTDPYLVRSMILGTIEHLCIRWHIMGAPSNLVDQVDPMIGIILNGIKAATPSKEVSIHLHLSENGIVLREPCDDAKKSNDGHSE
jgi:TetR/AcrR family transcriptional regulator, fatty acid metabolism regulator protein